MQEMKLSRHRGLRLLALAFGVPIVVLALVAMLFVVNGLVLCDGTTPRISNCGHPVAAPLSSGAELRVVSYNIAKAFAHRGGVTFERTATVRARVATLAEAVRLERPDLVFLSEAIRECGPCPVDQVAELADALGMNCTAFGEDYNFGLPFFRIVGGNAILSRWPLEAVVNMDVAGRKPFYVTKNNRRALWCALNIGGSRLLLASVHNDSFVASTNREQSQQLVAFASSNGPALIAGDFNAPPDSGSMQVYRDSGLFSGVYDGPPTFPARQPDRTIDFILAPAGWEVVEHKVISSTASDHCPVLTVFHIP
jgi:endonuclease/exonuclease/phosphatase family metal-dependent hydrolase